MTNDDGRTPQVAGAGHGEKFSRKREAALAALISEPTLVAAASMAGVSERTLRDWLADPSFAQDYRAARRALVEQAQTGLQANMGKAVAVLVAVAENEEVSASARVQACRTIIDAGLKAHELGELAERIEALERCIGGGRAH